jgi:hypothetical protein
MEHAGVARLDRPGACSVPLVVVTERRFTTNVNSDSQESHHEHVQDDLRRPALGGDAIARDRARALLGQVMGYVAVTVASPRSAPTSAAI